jgi:hypothetical protein
MPRAYRLVYRLLELRVSSRFARACARVLGSLSRSSPEGWLSAFERRFVRSGWPGHTVNWVNLHTSRFLTRVRREMRGAPPIRPRRARVPRRPLRVGIIGRFVGLLGFPAALFENCPSSIHLTVFDVPYAGRRAGYLRNIVHDYHAVDLDGSASDRSETRATAQAIADADLDLLVNVNWKPDAHDLLDILETGCVANYCTGSDLLHHPRVDVELLWQLQADTEIRGNHVWCTQTGLRVGSAFVYQISGLYDTRGLPFDAVRPWHDRDPLIVTHGSLYKFAVPEFAACMLDVLDANPHVDWILVGKDNGRALSQIEAFAARRGLRGRVHYEGEFTSVRNVDGAIDDPRWLAVQELLRRARLAPDPFPIGSGSSRFEAYLLGAPSPHIGVNGERAKSLASCELPILRIAASTAETVDEYREVSIRCLTDAAFAATVQEEQLAAARRASDPVRWWGEIEEAYWHWHRAKEAA